MVTGIDDYLPNQVKTLLRPVRDKDFFGRYGQSKPFFIPVGYKLPEREVPLGRRILEYVSSVLLQHRSRSFPDPINIDERRVREPPAKEMIAGSAVTLWISRMNDLGVFAIRDEKVK
jgi:hypothetical protein